MAQGDGSPEEPEPASSEEQVLALPCQYVPTFSASNVLLEGPGVVPQPHFPTCSAPDHGT